MSAVLLWERNFIYDEETGEEYPDPNDNPPDSVWVWEQASTKVRRSHNDPAYNAENPYQGQYFAPYQPTSHLGTEEARAETATTQQLYSTDGRPIALEDSSSSSNLTRYDTGGKDRLVLASCSLRGGAAATSNAWVGGRDMEANVWCNYRATPVNFALRSRRKESGQPFTEANIAAGGKDNSDHMAEIEVELTDATYGWPIPNVPIKKLPALKFSTDTGKGHTLDAEFLPPEQNGTVLYDPEAVTDSSGKALVGVMKSSDLKNGMHGWGHVTKVGLDTKNGGYQQEALVWQHWDQRDIWEYTPPLLLEGTMQPFK